MNSKPTDNPQSAADKLPRTMNYEKAFSELQTIVSRMENDELDIDQLTTQLRRAQQLVRLCKAKLTKTDEEIQKILAEEGEK